MRVKQGFVPPHSLKTFMTSRCNKSCGTRCPLRRRDAARKSGGPLARRPDVLLTPRGERITFTGRAAPFSTFGKDVPTLPRTFLGLRQRPSSRARIERLAGLCGPETKKWSWSLRLLIWSMLTAGSFRPLKGVIEGETADRDLFFVCRWSGDRVRWADCGDSE